MTIPPTLSPGDRIAILAPASAIDPHLVEDAAERLQTEQFTPIIYPSCSGRCGSYSATAEQRAHELQQAIDDLRVKAILCARGGYGCVHLLPGIRLHRPVWLIGFSDISALHALWQTNRQCSIHGSMAKELTLQRCPGDEANRRLIHLLKHGQNPPIVWPSSSGNTTGEARGILLGGNLAVISALIGTPYNIIGRKDSILLIEDIAEPVYKVERIMWQLRLSGALHNLRAIVCGQFTEYCPGPDGETMEQMLRRMLQPLGIPLAFNAPFGHVDRNLPIVLGQNVRLTVGTQECKLEKY